MSESTGESVIDAIVARAAAVNQQATHNHNALYVSLHEELQTELNADPKETE